MIKIEEEVIKLAKEFIKVRKKPILILNLPIIIDEVVNKLNSEIFTKKYNVLDVIIQTPGGDINSAYKITKILRNSSKIVNIIVPLYAKSAGTLISIAGDNIIMTSLSELGPLDTQIREKQEGDSPAYRSALNGFKALEQVQFHTLESLDLAVKIIVQRSGLRMSESVSLATNFVGSTSGTLYQQFDLRKIGECARALEIGEKYGITILTRYLHWNWEKADKVIKNLVKSYPDHSFAIDFDELCLLGFPAKLANEEEEKILDKMRELFNRMKGFYIKLIELPKSEQIEKRSEDSEKNK